MSPSCVSFSGILDGIQKGRGEKLSKQHKLNLTKGKSATTFTKSIEFLTQIVMDTLEFLLSFTLSQSGCEPCHYVWLEAVCELPPHLGLRQIAGFQGGERFYSRDRRFSTARELCQAQGHYLPDSPGQSGHLVLYF